MPAHRRSRFALAMIVTVVNMWLAVPSDAADDVRDRVVAACLRLYVHGEPADESAMFHAPIAAGLGVRSP